MHGDRSSRTTNLLTLLVLGYAALILFPVAWMATMMVKPEAVMFERPTVWWFTPTLEHFDFVLGAGFHWYLLTSFVIALASTLLVVIIGTPAAYAFARFEIWRRDDLFLFILATRMAPPVCLVIPFYLIYSKLGLIDTYAGLTIAYLTFNLVVLRLGAAQLLSRPAGRARGGGDGRGLSALAGAATDRPAAAAPRHRRHRRALLHLRLERVPVRFHARRQSGQDACRWRSRP